MRFTFVRDIRSNPKKVWNFLDKDGEVVLTSHGKPFAVMFPLQEEDLKEVLRSIRFAIAKVAVSRMRRFSEEKGIDKLSMEEIEEEICSVRKSSFGHFPTISSCSCH